MRIAYVTADQGVPVFGCKGCSIHVQEVIRALIGRGAEIDLISPRCEGSPPPGLEGIRLHRLTALARGDTAAREKNALERNKEISQALAQAGPFDLVYERYSLWSYAGMEYARKARIPGFLEVNAPLIEEQAQYRELVNRPKAEAVSRRVFQKASALLAVSEEMAAYLRAFGCKSDRIHVVPNGVTVNRFHYRTDASLEPTPHPVTIGFVGSLKPWHGLTSLLLAFAELRTRHPGVQLLIVGEGPERKSLEEVAREKGIEAQVTFVGAVPPAQVPSLLAQMHMAVAPYPQLNHFYFSPLKVFEYMAAGLPVVASATGQLVQLIQDGHNGILFRPGDVMALTEALARLAADKDLRFRLGHAARKMVLQEYTWDRVAGKIEQMARAARHSESPGLKVTA